MIDPLLTLALSLQASKGVYALLLGSGISKNAGIPTGWDIVLDLIRKLAAAKGEDCEPNPESWFRRLTGAEPDYSQILDQLTIFGADRVQLLRSYFEPTDDERQQGRKLPTRAHRSIAKLVAKGYVRVIVTTNFDRLIEQALSEEGVQATVISTTDSIIGALPMMHSACTVIKVHGDYLDNRLRNTPSELVTYEPSLNELLDRVFDEFGMIVCGWSVLWDVALRAAIERCKARRFSTYWTVHGTLQPEAEKLVNFRAARTIKITDADSFFGELAQRIQAIEAYAITDPISARVAVARLKRYLSTSDQRIDLYDFMTSETDRAYKGTRSERYPTDAVPTLTGADIEARLLGYESELHVLLPMMICGAYWANSDQYGLLLRPFKRLADGLHLLNGSMTLLNLRRYPALLLLYGLGLAAIGREDYRFLRELFQIRISAINNEMRPVLFDVHSSRVLALDIQRWLPSYKARYAPLSDHLFGILREHFREYIPDDAQFDETFDWFEYLLGLVYCDQTTSTEELATLKAKQEPWLIRGPFGRFVWKCEYGGRSIQQETEWQDGQPYPPKLAAVLREHVLSDRFRDIKRGYDIFIATIHLNWA